MIQLSRSTTRRLIVRGLAALGLLGLWSCGGGSSVEPPGEGGENGTPTLSINLPAQGTASTFDMATWNVEWLGDPGNGPANERLQLEGIREVISDLDLDLWSLQEVVSVASFRTLTDSLDGYDGLLANDASVINGPEYYNDFSGNEQKVGLLWKSDLLSVDSARVVLTAQDFEFAGRPPLEVQATLTLEGVSVPVVLFALHAKAGAEQEDWERRTAAATALKTYLDTRWPDTRVYLLGDFNDDVDVSIYNSATTPYDGFLSDAANWRFATSSLTSAGETSTVNFGDVIDHILVSNEAWAEFVTGSADVLSDLGSRTTGANYGEDVSDHYPVLARFTVGG